MQQNTHTLLYIHTHIHMSKACFIAHSCFETIQGSETEAWVYGGGGLTLLLLRYKRKWE